MNEKSHLHITMIQVIILALILTGLVGCTSTASAPAAATLAPSISSTATLTHAPAETATPAPSPTAESLPGGLTEEQAASLNSLAQVDAYPLYTMRFYGAYDQAGIYSQDMETERTPGWACSLFAALGDPDNLLFGRNFDWEFSPAVLLFTDPPDGYASTSMVDIAYLGFDGGGSHNLTDLPLTERKGLLGAPYLPFDGMNEQGLAIGMAAVPDGGMRPDPGKQTIGSLMVIRLILDQAATVDEAVAILESYNIDMEGGPALHYLVTDASGRSVLVEFYRGEMVVVPNEDDWQAATNFIVTSTGGSAAGACSRYDHITQLLTENNGQLTEDQAIGLLGDVSQDSTQWSVVYEMNDQGINVIMGQDYNAVHTFPLDYP